MQVQWILIFGLAVALLVFARSMTSAAAQTRAYFGTLRLWRSLWPFSKGKGLPRITRPLLKPCVPIWVQVEPGVRLHLDANNLISRVILETGVWDQDTWLAMERHLAPGATFVDIGAHDGYCSLKGARIVGPAGRVLAVEANPEMVTVLEKNIQASGARGIQVLPFACSDNEGVLTLFSASQSNTGSSSLSKANASQYGEPGQSYQVASRTLDAIIQKAGVSRVDLVKVDVEGAELLILKGALETLAHYRPALLLELDDQLLQPMGTSAAEVTEFLRAYGYVRGGQYDDANFEFLPVTTTQSDPVPRA